MTWLACLMVVVPAASPTTTTRSSSASAPAGAPRASTPLAAARQLAMTGRYDEAVAAYERIARQDPARRVPAAVGVADVMRLTGRYDEGLQRLTDVQPAGQKDAGWHLARARLLAARGQVDQAVEACRAAMGLEPDRYEARFRLAWLYEQTGELDRAARLYGFFDRLAHRRVPDRADQLVWHGRGFYRYSVLVRHPNLPKRTRYVLHELFQPAYETKDPQYWPARIAAAEQLYSKYNLVDAAEDYEAALAVNPKLPVAHAGLARIALEKWQFEACEKHLQGALDVNPKHVPSLNVRARLRLAERKCRQAAAEIDRALAVNPNDLEALSLAAAAHARLGERKVAERFEKRVAAINPRCALLPYTVAEWLAAARQFPQAEERYLQAARLDATWADPQTDLGLMYMQWGHEDKARKTLEAAWKLDRFNRKTFNVLKLLKQIEGFKRAESDHFIVKLDADEDAVLIPYFLDTLEAILPGLCRDYGHMPTAKTIVEVFPSHRAFSVRITSRPWIHTIGACTGRVIAMDAPRVGASMTGSFDWVRVLRHELTHTVTLAATHNRIPHWFTEALAVRSENAPLSFRWMLLLSRALRRDRLFGLDDIDWSFIRPKRPGDREQAYAQSRWMADFIVAEFGHDAIRRLLEQFDKSKEPDEALRAVFGLDAAGFSARFRDWAAKQVQTWGLPVEPIAPVETLRSRVAQHPKQGASHAALAEALLYDGDTKHADEAARRALKLDADNVLALTARCTVLMETWQHASGSLARQELARRAEPLLHRLARLDAANIAAPRYLARLALDGDGPKAAKPWLERLRGVSPHDPVAAQGLAALYLEQGLHDQALRELTTLAIHNEDDAALPLKIARLALRLGKKKQAAHWFGRAIHIDPYDAETHEQYAALATNLGQTEVAVREVRALCDLQPDRSEHFARLAVLHMKAGQRDQAVQAAQRAVALDADSPAKTLLEPAAP